MPAVLAADFVAAQTEHSDLAEGLYLKDEAEGAVIGRYKYVRADFLQAIEASDGHWQDWPILANVLAAGVDIFAPLDACPQDPLHHGEGLHTRMVVEALVGLPAWRNMPPDDRALLFWAACLHDIGKPATTKEEGGRITSRGHSRVGA